jgi:CRP-like cAMP-binding protein/uncharacterized membrane protein YphA (DoxX/SURF4 family)/rhodanese-related sulfurtransferase
MAETEGPAGEKELYQLRLEHVGREITVPQGTCIVKQGEPPTYFYVIKSGQVRVFRQSPEGIRTELNVLGPGAYFGEMALISGKPRAATVEATEQTVLVQISKEEFNLVLDHNPTFARSLIETMSERLVDTDERVEKETVDQAKRRQISWFDYVLMLGLSVVLALVFNLYNDNQIPLIHGLGAHYGVEEISLDRARELYQKKQAAFVDARKDAFYQQRHIKGADNLPVLFFDLQFPMFQFMLMQKEVGKDQPLIVYGGSTSRRFDRELAHLLKEKDYTKVMVMASDPEAWQKSFPVEEKPGKAAAAMPLGLPGYIEWLPVGIFLLILIPPVRQSPYLSAFCRVLLGVIFIQFALSKIMRPAVFALNVVDYAMMPAWGVNLWALVLPWAELVAGLFLILGIRTRAAATIIGGMNIIFIVGLINAIFLQLPINCGCVGEAGEPVNWWKVLKNTGMLVMALQIFLYDRLFVLDRGGFIWRERKI